MPELSIIVPFFNEEGSIGPLYSAIVAAVTPLGVSFEMLFVDDGSTDRTLELAIELARHDPRVRVVRFRRNYGQTPAMAAGIEYARGATLLTLDGDLQNDPADIELFLDKIATGYDIVVGWRANREDHLITRKLPSRVANWLIGKVTGVPIRDNGCSLKAYRATLIKSIPLYCEMHRFIPAVASIAGPRIAELKVRHHARRYGKSKYGLSRIYKVLLDLMVIKTVTAFMSRPLLWFGLMALPVLVLGVGLTGYSLLAPLLAGTRVSLPIAGSGVIFTSCAFILLSGGALAELVYKLGDVRDHEFSRLTARVWQYGV
ncbi:MAG: glycosyltransferase family 2 protein [Steroidobacteraceae bacterium]